MECASVKETVIDFHVHLSYYESMTKDIFEFFSASYSSREEYIAFCQKYSNPLSFIELMDKNGVDYSVILAEMAPLTSGYVMNERVKEYCQASTRMIPFCTLNPYLHSNMGKTLEDLCLNNSFKGIKLYPSYNYFYPNENFMYPLYTVAEGLGIPVLFHTGTSIFSNSRLKYSNPIFIDDVAIDFPNMKIIMAHGGRGPWYNIASSLIRLHKNVYIDITGLPPKNLLNYFPDMDRFADKFIFGTDWPSVDVSKNIDAIRKLNISQDAIVKILGENAKQLLGLKV